MRQLAEIYEGARVNIPLRTFAGRNTLLAWGDLDARVRSELDVLQERIFSALRGDHLLLENHYRVIGDFNRGVRRGILPEPGEAPPAGSVHGRSPYEWGRIVGSRSSIRDEAGALLIKQFITVTHLLAYEFRQLNLASYVSS